MYLVFVSKDDWFKSHPGLKEKFEDTFKAICAGAQAQAKALATQVSNRTGKNIDLQISGQLLEQALIDAFDDLLRLTNYHPTDAPNPIKEMAYIAYWFLRRKPLQVVPEDIISNISLSDTARSRLLFVNEEFCVTLLLNAAFEGRRKVCPYTDIHKTAEKQRKYFQQFLLYYLAYRVDSPKSLEAIMLSCTIHPIWEVAPIIWSDLKPLTSNS